MSDADTSDEPVEIIDPLDEVIQQISEQALRMSHLDETVRGVGQSVFDLNEAMQAGFAEVRARADTASASAAPPTGLTERLDVIEEQQGRLASRQRWIMLLLVLLLGAAGLLTAATLGLLRQLRDSDAPAAPVSVAAPATPTPVIPQAAAPSPDNKAAAATAGAPSPGAKQKAKLHKHP